RHHINLRPKKCSFGFEELEYLGHKNEDILQFYKMAGPLHELTENNVDFKWLFIEQQAFKHLTNAMMSAPILAYPSEEEGNNVAMNSGLSPINELPGIRYEDNPERGGIELFIAGWESAFAWDDVPSDYLIEYRFGDLREVKVSRKKQESEVWIDVGGTGTSVNWDLKLHLHFTRRNGISFEVMDDLDIPSRYLIGGRQKHHQGLNPKICQGPAIVTQLEGQGPAILGQLEGQGPAIVGQLEGQGPAIVGQLEGQGPAIVGQLEGQGPAIVGQLEDQGPAIVGQLEGQGPDIVGQLEDQGPAIVGQLEGQGAAIVGQGPAIVGNASIAAEPPMRSPNIRNQTVCRYCVHCNHQVNRNWDWCRFEYCGQPIVEIVPMLATPAGWSVCAGCMTVFIGDGQRHRSLQWRKLSKTSKNRLPQRRIMHKTHVKQLWKRQPLSLTSTKTTLVMTLSRAEEHCFWSLDTCRRIMVLLLKHYYSMGYLRKMALTGNAGNQTRRKRSASESNPTSPGPAANAPRLALPMIHRKMCYAAWLKRKPIAVGLKNEFPEEYHEFLKLVEEKCRYEIGKILGYFRQFYNDDGKMKSNKDKKAKEAHPILQGFDDANSESESSAES
ncbi:unnamed protein product, partial [Allacma fusca]